MSDKNVGLVEKYRVERVSGRSVNWCFVLEDTDPITPFALAAYAHEARERGYKLLADDLFDKLAQLNPALGAALYHPRGQA